MRAPSLQQVDCSILAEHRREERSYDSLQRGYYYLHTVMDIYDNLENFSQCPYMGTKFRDQKQMEPFPPDGPLECISIGIL